MSRVDELFSKYGSAGRVEVANSSYESPLFRKERKKQMKKKKTCETKKNNHQKIEKN
mgnify:CR=1 FL=1